MRKSLTCIFVMLTMRIARIIVCLLSLLPYLSLNAQVGQYRFSRIDISQGLSHNEVNCIFKDEKGFMWFGTRSGLDRFDGYKFKIYKHDLRDTSSISDEEIEQIFEGPDHKLWINTKSSLVIYDLLTEKFDRHPQSFLKAIGIPDASLLDLKKDRNGNYWFLGASSGLYKYFPATGKTIHFLNKAKNSITDASSNITGFAVSDNFLWMVNSNCFLAKIDANTGKMIFGTNALQNVAKKLSNYQVYIDAQGDLWVYSPGAPQGIFYFDVAHSKMIHISKGNNQKNLNNDFVRSVAQDETGLIWLATDHGGINLLDKKDFTTRYLLNYEDDNYSIAQNSINSMYKDNGGIIWIGTFKKGISYYNKGIIKFPLYHHKPSDPNSLSYNDINRFIEDNKGNIWIGTNGGGLLYFDRKTGKFTRYSHNPSNKNSLCNDVVVSLCIDHDNTLWIGTYFGGLDHYDGKKFTHYSHSDADTSSISDNAIWSIMEDSQHHIWIGTFSSGLDRYERASNTFTHFKATGFHSVHSKYVCDLLEAKNGDIWIATSNGVDVFEQKTDDFSRYYHHDASKPSLSLSNDNTIALLQDSRGLIWIATRDGLTYYDQAKKEFKTLRKEDGLADNIIVSIVEDKQHNIWAGTPNGLSNIIVSKNNRTGKLSFQFRNYNQSDGLQGKEFNEYAACVTKQGELLFGGPNGFNMFTPQQIDNSNYNLQLVLTDLQMFNKSVNVGEKFGGHIILPESISDTKEITLNYNENIFSIEFAALNFFNTFKLRYAYTLKGFNNEWFIADDKTHKATYTNLDPGSYVFKVRTINENGTLGDNGTSLKINILPPLWRTPYAYALYILLLIALLYIGRRIILQRARMRFAIEEERREAHRLHDLDMMKIRFFTNVSHELRTPLSLILTPLDKIIKNATEPLQKHQFQMIHRNARRLLNLVNQLLDFRKMEMRELQLQPTKGNIINFIQEVSYSFTDLAAKNHIIFSFNTSTDSLFTEFDHDKIERILFNLLSNAFKFTHDNGSVAVSLKVNRKEDETILEINVRDSGIGISPEKHEKIFERFFRNNIPENMVNQGSGIGLAITKEFVKLHNGSITVESKVNYGSCFTLLLPFKELQPDLNENISYEKNENSGNFYAEPGNEESQELLQIKTISDKAVQKRTVLLVEDNDDLRFYLKENLEQYFNVIEASNGKSGWQKTLSSHPDIIVSDISMPEMSGIDLCRKIKNDKRTSFVPVILLTALMGDKQQLKGLETGASDYMTKPFNFEILLSKIRNLLAQQESARRAYQKLVKAEPSIHVDSRDEKFMHHALEIIEKNIANPNFSVEELSRELYISRVGLYKKMLALTGKSPLEFIKSVRLQWATQLLEKSQLTIAEIAYEVGFNDPKYFSKFFKASFNILPSAYQAKKRKEREITEIVAKEEEK
jgi:signal transduction histidine kinase/ligand-binding sensor domain-containing protein/DNA-binding response OmpR family regulator